MPENALRVTVPATVVAGAAVVEATVMVVNATTGRFPSAI